MKPAIDNQHSALSPRMSIPLTLERRETSVKNELEITKLTLIEDNGGQSLGLINELLATRGIASDEVLQDTTFASNQSPQAIQVCACIVLIPWGGLAMTASAELYMQSMKERKGKRVMQRG